MLDSIKAITAAMIESYERIGGINHLDGFNLPSRRAVSDILADYESLVFPGFRDEAPVQSDDLGFVTAETINRLARSLTAEIGKSLCYLRRHEGGACCLPPGPCREHRACTGEAEGMALDILGRCAELRELARLDVEAAYKGDPAAKHTEEVILAYPGLEAIIVHRFAHELWTRGVALLPRMMSELIHGRTGIDIHPGASIGRSFFIDHGTGVVIGETTVIGDGVKLYQGVTLGALSVRKEESDIKRHPTIEDGVTIYAGATILGGKTVIGRGSVIGGNVWLTSSVEPGSRIYNRADRSEA